MAASFEDQVALACYDIYKKMGKKGKPEVGREWTKMSGIVQTSTNGELKVICLATGTKCIGKNTRTKTGNLLNDSHAEVLARRLLIKYLYQQLRVSLLFGDGHSIFVESLVDKRTFELKDDIKFHLFTTDIPCGDACIFLRGSRKRKSMHTADDTKFSKKMVQVDDNYMHLNKFDSKERLTCVTKEETIDNAKANFNQTCSSKPMVSNHFNCSCDSSHYRVYEIGTNESYKTCDCATKAFSCEGENSFMQLDIHRTGAKCVPSGNQDLMLPGVDYHVVRALRIKPGRGDPTVSMSCSDKIMKWCVLGIQGGILRNFIKNSIFLSSIIIADVHFDLVAIQRSLSFRNRTNKDQLTIHVPDILHTTCLFEHRKEAISSKENILKKTASGKITPSGSAILWSQICNIHEVSANGRLLGVTKKDFNTSKIRTSVCKSSLFEDFKSINRDFNFGDTELLSYYNAKHASEHYENQRKSFFKLFPDWITKPKELEDFL